MANTYPNICEMYADALKTLSADVGAWTGFLRAAGRNYKLPFEEQVLVYAQRPDAQAVLTIERWNKSFGRWVNAGATGIAVFGTPGTRALRYYFDVSDTHKTALSRPVPIWHVDGEHESSIAEALDASFDAGEATHPLAHTLVETARNIARDNKGDYLDVLLSTRSQSALATLSDTQAERMFARLVETSVEYTLLARCGFDIDTLDYPSASDELALFNTVETMNALGCAVSDTSETALRVIAKSVLVLDAEREHANRSVAQDLETHDNSTQKQPKARSNDEDSVRASRGIQPADGGRPRDEHGSTGGLRPDEAELLEELSSGAVHEPAHHQQVEPALRRDRDSGGADGEASRISNDEARGSGRSVEGTRPNGMGRPDEQHPDEGERGRDGGIGLLLKAPPSAREQQQAIQEAAEKSVASFVEEEIGTFPLGSRVALGSETFEVIAYRNDVVVLFDDTSPLFPREMGRSEFERKAAETPQGVFASQTPPVPMPKAPQNPLSKRSRKPPLSPDQTLLDVSENFTIKGEGQSRRTLTERLDDNIEALRILKQLDRGGRTASQLDQVRLSRFAGWGSLSKVFDEDDGAWKNQKTALRELLTNSEYEAARASTLNAHYTSPLVISAMYEALANMGFSEGNVLEPACGTGAFFGLIPEAMKKSSLYGVELDPVTARIAQHLYPKADIRACGFEETTYPDNFFDVAIGNVPFGSYSVADARYDAQRFMIHDYFFAHALDAVRPGGVVAFITSKGTLDKKNPKVRRYLAERAYLIGAIRLPNTAFETNAGTKVTADIIFLQKRDRPLAIEPDWVHLDTNEDGIALNSYFVDHPDMVLGTMTHENVLFYGRGDETTCVPFDGEDLGELLRGAIGNIHTAITKYEREEPEADETSLPADPTVRNYSYTTINEKVYFRIDSRMHLSDLTKTGASRVRGMVEIRDVLRELIDLQTADAPESEIKRLQAKLNYCYDSFTKKYGILNSRANATAFSEDSAYALLCALEDLDGEGNLVGKADMFSKRTIRPAAVVQHAETSTEALAASLGEKGRVDLPFMASLTGKGESQIATELQGVIFLNPATNTYQAADEYLSGNVREKLAIAEACAKSDARYAPNVEALAQVVPEDIGANEINVRLGATWVPTDDVQAFMYELLETPMWRQSDIRVHYSPITAQWSVSGKSRDGSNVRAIATFGTHRANAYRIIEDTLNLRDTRIFDYVTDLEGKKTAVLNKQETAIALSKQDSIKEAFQNWIFDDPARRERLVRAYNDTFNSMRLRTFNGSHLTFPGMNPEIKFREHQINAVARILYGNNALLGHEVGAGKTYVIAAATQELKRIGLANKSLIVVPNHLTEQWASEYLRLYPAANILVATKRDFEKQNRRRFCARIATGDYDAVIIGHTQFEKIPVSVERQQEMIQREIDEVTAGISELKAQKGERYSIKQMESSRKKLEVRLKRLNDQDGKDDVIEFEQLGIDRLFVDESHNYKNLFFYTKMRNVGGIPQTEALKSSDLFMKCRYLNEKTGGKGIVFATGTPISNSMAELYTVQRYLQYDDLARLGLAHFDCWASTFGETVTAIELAPEGTGYRQKTRFAKFYNLPELMTLFRQVADIQTADMLSLPVPKVNFHNVSVEPSEFQRELVEQLSERADRVRNRMVDATQDNMLLITNDGRKLALDQRLINPELPDSPTGKSAVCAANVFEIWERHADKRSTQLIFCDLSTPKQDGTFSVYNDIRAKLVEKGLPDDEIAFIHDFNTEAKKAELFGKVRSGQVRVLLGSTQKMGAGTNVQSRLVALHDLDCPWRPSDLQQRLGRIERQGNQNEEVEVFRYVTENTFDAYLYQLVENKQKFISQIMTSKSPVRAAADVDETALSYAELKALATGNPLIKERMDLEVEVSRLKVLKSNHLSQKYSCEDKLLQVYPQKVAALAERINGFEADARTARANPPAEKESFSMTVGAVAYSDKQEAGAALLAFAKTLSSPKTVPLGRYRGFDLEIGFDVVSRCYEA